MFKKSIIFYICIIHTAIILPLTLPFNPPVTETFDQLRNQRMAERTLRVMSALSDFSNETHLCNNDETTFEDDRRANFGKSFDLDLTAMTPTFHKTGYDALLDALNTQLESDFNALQLFVEATSSIETQAFKLVNPMALFSYDFIGADGWSFTIDAAPSIQSAEAATEMIEVYWHSLLRDVTFNTYCSNTTASNAVADLDSFGSDFTGPKDGGTVTAKTLFRGVWTGDTVGPYVSQFLYLPVAAGAPINYDGSGPAASDFEDPVYQTFAVPAQAPDNVFMTDTTEWERIQKGLEPTSSTVYDTTGRHFIRNGRDLAEYVHYDYPGQAGIHAALILLSFGSDALDPACYYIGNESQVGFTTFGVTSIITAVQKAAELALKAAWFQKWYVHRRLRPEFFAYLVEIDSSLTTPTGFHAHLTNTTVFDEDQFDTIQNNKLLPMAYPEGSPCHPSYPAGHATIAGACVTVLKAFFKESFIINNIDGMGTSKAVQPDASNTNLIEYPSTSDNLTIEGELNKLASNISIGRNFAGVHYRSDGTQGMLLGEKVAIKLLSDLAKTYHETFPGFSLTKFDGTTITIGGNS